LTSHRCESLLIRYAEGGKPIPTIRYGFTHWNWTKENVGTLTVEVSVGCRTSIFTKWIAPSIVENAR
jgi:hypothetical protein